MKKLMDNASLCARAEAHATMLESAAALMELDGMGVAPESGHVHHLRRMAGAIRAQAALGQVPQSYTGGRYLPDPGLTGANHDDHGLPRGSVNSAWH